MIQLYNLKGDFNGAISAAIITLPMSIGYGVTAFAPLGSEFAPQAAIVGLNAAIIGGFFAALLGGTPIQITGPKAPLTLILATVVAGLQVSSEIPANLVNREILIVGLTSCCVFAGGVSQLIFGSLRMGSIVKCIPYPVVAGFMNGIAALLIWKQLPILLGIGNSGTLMDIFVGVGSVNNLSLVAGCMTIAAIFLAKRHIKSIPSSLIGILVGTAAYYLLLFQSDHVHPVRTLGHVSAGFPLPTIFWELAVQATQLQLYKILPHLIGYGIIIGFIGSMESLMSSVAIDNRTATRHDSNKELMGQGMGNIAASFFGALFSAGSIPRSFASYHGGSRTKLAGLVCSCFILLIFLTMAPAISRIPLAVFAGVIMTVGFYLFDRQTLQMLKSIRNSSKLEQDVLIDLTVILFVSIITVTVSLIIAVLVGVAISFTYFVLKMGSAMTAHEYTAHCTYSGNARPSGQMESLKRDEKKIIVFELQGPLFFGSASRLLDIIEQKTGCAACCILDMKHVNEIDSTAVKVLIQIHNRFAKENKRLFISHITETHVKWEFLKMMGLVAELSQNNFFANTDKAIERAEDQLAAHQLPLETHNANESDNLEVINNINPRNIELWRSSSG